jgi:hypothetical protein
MEEKKRTLSSNAIYYGLIAGAAMILYGLVLFLLDQHMNKGLSYVGYVFLIGGMVWGTIEYRNKFNNGFLSYGPAFKSCFMIALYASILSAIYMFVFAQFIHPGLLNEMLDQSRQAIIDKYPDWNDEQIEQAVSMTTKFMSPWILAIGAFIAEVVIGTLAGLILAIFLKKVDKSIPPPIQ